MQEQHGPIHVRLALFESVSALVREHLKDYRALAVLVEKSPELTEQVERLAEIRGALKGLRGVLYTLKRDIGSELDETFKGLTP